jgi:DNA-binding transcriptional LysR family regulator
MLDASSLRLLHEVARTGSYTAAARELGYSQPAVSYKMRALERAAGVTLVVRVGRGMRLTPAGEILAGHARAVVAALKAADEAVAEIKGNRIGRVRIAAFQSACSVLMPNVIATLRRELPEVEISLTGVAPHASLSMVRAGEVDVAVVFGYDDDPPDDPLLREASGLRHVPLMTDRVFVQLPVDHPLAEREVIPLSALAQEHWVVSTPKNQDKLRRACEAAGFTPAITTTADDTLAQEALVANRLGIGLQPGLLTVLHHDPRVVNRLIEPWPTRRISALMWPDMTKVPAVRSFLDALAATAAQVQAQFSAGD